MSSKTEDGSAAHQAIQRLVNGDVGNWTTYLDGFFEGKDVAAIERGACVLLEIIERGTCKPEGIPALAEYVVALSKSRSLLDLPIERTLVGVTRRVLSAAPGIGIRQGYSRSEFEMLSTLLHLEGERYVAAVSRELARQAAEAVVHPGVWIDIVRKLSWTTAIGAVGNTELTRAGNPELTRLFKGHCLAASDLYAGRGQSGIAAALYTISESGDPRGYYERARTADQAVALNCVETYEMRGAPDWSPLTRDPQRSDDELYQELFGQAWRAHPERDYREPYLKEQFEIDRQGEIVLTNDSCAQRVADRLLSRGLWNEVQRAMHLLSRPKGGQGRYIFSIVLPAMYAAEREGCIAIAAALGQIALASHQAAPRSGQEASRSMIVYVARSVTASVYGARDHEIQHEIRAYTDPIPGCDGFGGYASPQPQPVPEHLRSSERALAAEQSEFEAKLIGQILGTINRLFDMVIEQGIPLKLELF